MIKGVWRGETAVIDMHGSEIPVSQVILSHEDELGNVQYFTSISRDISQQKRSREQLNVERKKLKGILEAMGEEIYIVNGRHEIEYINPAMRRAFGPKRKMKCYEYMSDLEAPCPWCKLPVILQGKKARWEWQSEKTGKIYDVMDVPFTHEDGSISKLKIMRDITKRKKMEVKIREARDNLGKRVKERTEHLVRLNRELEKEVGRHKRTRQKLRSLATKLIETEERERRRIATDLHDRIIQTLVISRMELRNVLESLPSEKQKKSLEGVHNHLQQTIHDLRTMTFELSPPILYELGFIPALKWLVDQLRKRQDIRVQFNDDGSEKPLREEVRTILFQAVRECLNNIEKHARANNIDVTASKGEGMIQVDVADDGIGFHSEKLTSDMDTMTGFGLFNIQERLEDIGGNLRIKSKPHGGTRVRMQAPLQILK
jgi:signal transduction histidine kinase